MSKNPRKRTGRGLLVALLCLVSLLVAACGDNTATSIPPATTTATTAAATTAATTTAASTTAVATTSAATTATTVTTAASGTGTTASGELVVFAASSLTDSFNQIKAD